MATTTPPDGPGFPVVVTVVECKDCFEVVVDLEGGKRLHVYSSGLQKPFESGGEQLCHFKHGLALLHPSKRLQSSYLGITVCGVWMEVFFESFFLSPKYILGIRRPDHRVRVRVRERIVVNSGSFYTSLVSRKKL